MRIAEDYETIEAFSYCGRWPTWKRIWFR